MRKGTLLFHFIIVASPDLCCSHCSGGEFPACRISLDHMVTHCVYSQARVMVFPVSIMNDLYYLLPFCLVLYLALVVRFIGRHNYIYKLVHIHPPTHMHTLNLWKRYQER
jgi:hypothetical protein